MTIKETSQVYYLNNSGTRWIVLENSKKPVHPFKTKSGKIITRTVIFYESFGNFGSICINYKGSKIKVLTDTVLDD